MAAYHHPWRRRRVHLILWLLLLHLNDNVLMMLLPLLHIIPAKQDFALRLLRGVDIGCGRNVCR